MDKKSILIALGLTAVVVIIGIVLDIATKWNRDVGCAGIAIIAIFAVVLATVSMLRE